MKLRKNEMKLRKNEIKVPKNFFVSHWIIEDFHRGIVLFLKKVHSWGGVTEMVLGLFLLFL